MNVTDLAFWGTLSIVSTLNAVATISGAIPTNTIVTADYFEPLDIDAFRVGDTAAIYFNRTIHRPVTMSFTVRVMELTPNGWSQFCHMEGPPIEYIPTAVLFDKNAPMNGSVGLDWWTYGKCAKLPDGDAQIWTTWEPKQVGLLPVSIKVDVKGKE